MGNQFKVEVLSATANPQRLIYQAMRQCHSPFPIYTGDYDKYEAKYGELVVKHLLQGGRGHYGPLEHPVITFNCGNFPHSVIQQATRHRIATWDVQSFRETSAQIVAVSEERLTVEDVVYLRPVGIYHDRKTGRFEYTERMRQFDLDYCKQAIDCYASNVKRGMPPEQARGLLCFDYRQHFVASFNLRSLMHFLNVRSKKDAQLEIQSLSKLMFEKMQTWVPEIATWYEKNEFEKGTLAP